MENDESLYIQFREFDRRVFEKSKVWLNDVEIKRLTITPDTDLETKENWFGNLKYKKDYFIRSVWCGNEPIGVVGLKHITPNDAEYFIYIGEKEYWGKRIGTEMLKYILDFGRSISLSSVYGEILKENTNSIKLANRFGFKYEKEKNDNTIIMRLYLDSIPII